MAEPYSFGIDPITCHAWNKNRTKLALSPNSSEVHIYEKSGAEWKLAHVLKEHDLRVTGIDWAPNTDRIVTCSADRNAYVWSQDASGKWLPTLVLLRINRAATCVRWSPLENKFAVGSGARLVSICYFEKENNWWVSKHIKKPIRSTVTSLDWHPNNILIACGSTDYKARIFSAWVKDIEDKPTPTSWGVKMPFQQLMAEFPCSSNGGGWIHSVSFSEDGTKLCWVGHDSSVSVVDSANNMVMYNLKTDQLPFTSCLWISDTSVVAAGHGCCPMLYSLVKGQLQFVGKLDNKLKKESAGISAFKRFQTMDRQARSEIEDTSLGTVHQNAISGTCLFKGNKSSATHFSSSGIDGQVVVWDIKSLEATMRDLKI